MLILLALAVAAEGQLEREPLLLLRPAPGCRVDLLRVPTEENVTLGVECRLLWSFHPGLEATVEADCRKDGARAEVDTVTSGWAWSVAPQARADDRCTLDLTLARDAVQGLHVGVPGRAVVGGQALTHPFHETTPPRWRRRAQPTGAVSLPDALRGEARCQVELALDDRGVPVDATVTACDDASLVERSRQAALGWRFHPATLDGEPVASGFELRFVYHTPGYQPPTGSEWGLDAD